jgi:aminopeptidase YwaD
MKREEIIEKATAHLQQLCTVIGERRVGSEANRVASRYAEKVLTGQGWQTRTTLLEVIDWQEEGATVACQGRKFAVFPSPYSLGCSVTGELTAVSSMEQLSATDISDKIVLLHGEIAAQQIAPKKFPFWNPEKHRQLIAMLEQGKPLALLCATSHNAALAGGVYPFLLFEDGDFDIPSVYMKDIEGEKLLVHVGETVELISRARRIPETAYNVTGRNSDQSQGRIVISAHVDTKIGTPGAIDNGTGVTVLLLLAELLKEDSGKQPVELLFLNGEDYYGAPGQVKYMEQHAGEFGDILLNINIDGAGYKEGPTCFSPFGLPEKMQKVLQEIIDKEPEIVEGLPWYQGDHSMFLQQGCPAIAVSSHWFIEHMETQEITHTPKDNLEVVNCERVAEAAMAIAQFVRRLEAI